MTQEGELYINEVCRDVFEEEMDAVFGKGKWDLHGCVGATIDEVPLMAAVDVNDESGKKKLEFWLLEKRNKLNRNHYKHYRH